MADLHITRDLLRVVSRGEIPPRLLTQLGVQRLMTLCPHCRAEILAWQREREAGPPGYDRAFRVLPALLGRHAEPADRQQVEAERDARALLDLPREERIEKVRRARVRFRGMALVRPSLTRAGGRSPQTRPSPFIWHSLAPSSTIRPRRLTLST